MKPANYVTWSCNHCLAFCFVGDVTPEAQAEAAQHAKEHVDTFSHSVEAKKIENGETTRTAVWGVAQAKAAGFITESGHVVRDC